MSLFSPDGLKSAARLRACEGAFFESRAHRHLCRSVHRRDLVLRFGWPPTAELHGISVSALPLLACLTLGGIPLVWTLLVKVRRAEFSSDILAGISIVAASLLGEYLAGARGPHAFGRRSARSLRGPTHSSVLEALANRMPSVAHVRLNGNARDIPVTDLRVGQVLLIFPHEICPADGTVVEGHGSMDESYLTGEPYVMSKRRARPSCREQSTASPC